MPTYEYVCDSCEHTFDEFQYFSEAPLKKCPECKKNKLRRLFGTGASVIFKGSGFYETDYRSESYKSGAKAESDAQKPAAKEEKPAGTSPPASESGGGKKGASGKKAKTGTGE